MFLLSSLLSEEKCLGDMVTSLVLSLLLVIFLHNQITSTKHIPQVLATQFLFISKDIPVIYHVLKYNYKWKDLEVREVLELTDAGLARFFALSPALPSSLT